MAFVRVPGQRFRHAHICSHCGNIWKHKAPTPMTEATNDAIHTCPSCGQKRYIIDYAAPLFLGFDPETFAFFAVLAVGTAILLMRVRHV